MATMTPSATSDSYLGENPAAERIYDNVQTTVPGAPVLSLVKMQLWNAIEQFALDSTYFRDRVQWSMGPGIIDYDFNPYDGNATVCWVLGVSGLVRYHVEPPALLIDDFHRSSSALRHGRAIVVLKPLRFDETLPPVLFTNWFETLLSGTLGRLYAMPARPWTSPQFAEVHLRKAQAGAGKARDAANRSNTNRPTWQFPYFAAGRRKN